MQFLTSSIILIINNNVAIITHRGLWMGHGRRSVKNWYAKYGPCEKSYRRLNKSMNSTLNFDILVSAGEELLLENFTVV